MVIQAFVVAAVLFMLLIERLSIVALTRSERGRQWIIVHPILHPNVISFMRIPMGVASVGLWVLGFKVFAILWFAFWMITDLTDGTVARHCDMTTESGKWLDPLSDKCMYFPLLIFFAFDGVLSVPWTVVLLLVDAFGQASRLFSKKKAANYFGKAKTAMVTVLLSLIALNALEQLPFMTERFIEMLTMSCALLAFLSVYCKMIPDRWYANSLTLANFLCGLFAIYSVIVVQNSLRAFILVFVGQFFDLFDGRLARKYGSTLRGAFYDDIADGTSFGLAIALLIWFELKQPLPLVSIVTGTIYFVCVIFRLYRFLLTAKKIPAGTFQGLPAPAGAMFAGAAALLFNSSLSLLAIVLVLFASALMVSSVPYMHFGQRIWPSLPRGIRVLIFVLILLFFNISMADRANYADSFKLFCFLMAGLYLLYGIDFRRLRRTARKKPKGA